MNLIIATFGIYPMKKLLLSVFIFLFILTIFIYWSGHNYLQVSSNNIVLKLKSNNIENDITLNDGHIKLMTWNVSYFYGLGSDGSAYEKKKGSYYENKIISAARLIREQNVDIVCFQEIDFKSSRSHYMDQLKEVAELTGLKYIAYAPSWQANYVPYPYFSNHFGKMYSGGGVISRFPILNNRVELLPKPSSNPWWYNHLYLNRFVQMVEIQAGDRKLSLFNTHLEAFDMVNRTEQAHIIKKLASLENVSLIVGDFNTIPDSAEKRKDFSGYPEDQYELDKTYNILLNMGFDQSIENDRTFPAHRPDRKLDYILYKKSVFSLINSSVINTQESDHRPIISNLKFND